MSISQLRIHGECELFGKLHKIVSINPPHIWLKRPDNETFSIEYSSLITNPSFKPLRSMIVTKKDSIPFDSQLAKLKPSKREDVSKRFELIKPLLLLEQIKCGDMQSLIQFKDKYLFLMDDSTEDLEKLSQDELIKRIKKKKGSSRSSIMRYLTAYKSNGEEGLISDKGSGTNKRKDNLKLVINDPDDPDIILDTLTVRLSSKQIEILKEVIENEYLTRLKPSVATIHRSAKNKCMDKQEPEIKYITICHIIERISKRVKETRRNPSKAKRTYDEVARGYADREALGRLDIIQMDHANLDIPAVDDITGLVVARPWLTLGLCVHSREPWCVHLSAEGPSENVVRKAIKNGVSPKNTRTLYGTQQEWGASGILGLEKSLSCRR
ncbi:hypothetical protein PASE110613_16845 [Paenibacillus sediminis]|uniref:Uncharacterized protein n=1 Tax=Paenibacillus sediminis TaxID=664909 RepID=A0ABS4H7R3_9BACL|nr:hypothetical protein [Paenibacillus sediminis]MBP1938567.1 hypothetical protein [Paenibacillus sediminis]